MNTKEIANRIEAICNEKKITVKKMLSECGLNKNVVDNMKKEKSSVPAIDKILPIAQYFDVSVDYLLGNDDVPNRKDTQDFSKINRQYEIKVYIDEEQELLNTFRLLNSNNKIKVLERALMLSEMQSPYVGTKDAIEAANDNDFTRILEAKHTDTE